MDALAKECICIRINVQATQTQTQTQTQSHAAPEIAAADDAAPKNTTSLLGLLVVAGCWVGAEALLSGYAIYG